MPRQARSGYPRWASRTARTTQTQGKYTAGSSSLPGQLPAALRDGAIRGDPPHRPPLDDRDLEERKGIRFRPAPRAPWSADDQHRSGRVVAGRGGAAHLGDYFGTTVHYAARVA